MSESRSDKLVREILELYAKYGETCFEDALSKLESGEVSKLISRVGRASVENVDRRKPIQRTRRVAVSRANKVASFVASLQYSNDAKKRFIGEFTHQLLVKSLLASGKSLAAFASRIGVDVGRKIDRGILIQRVGERLLDLDFDFAKEAIEFSKEVDNKKSSLQEWSKIIVKDNNN